MALEFLGFFFVPSERKPPNEYCISKKLCINVKKTQNLGNLTYCNGLDVFKDFFLDEERYFIYNNRILNEPDFCSHYQLLISLKASSKR